MATIIDVHNELMRTVDCTGNVFKVVSREPRNKGEIALQVLKDFNEVPCLHWLDQLTDGDLERGELQCRILAFKNEKEFDHTSMGRRKFGTTQEVYGDLERFHCGWNVGRRHGVAAAKEAVNDYMNRMET